MTVPFSIISKKFYCGWLLVAAGLLVACSSGTGERKVLPVDEMAKVLYDFQLATSLSQIDDQEVSDGSALSSPTDSALMANHKEYLEYRSAVFEKYKITEGDYKHSLAFYLRNPGEMKKLNAELSRHLLTVSQASVEGSKSAGNVDSVLVWQKNAVLLDAASNNRFIYEGTAKGKRLHNEALILNFDAQWLYGGGNKQALAFLTAIYDNDSTATTSYTVYYFQTHHEVRLALGERKLKKVSVQFVTSNFWEAYPQIVNLSNIRLHRVKDAIPETSTQ